MGSDVTASLTTGPMAPAMSCLAYSLCSISMVLANKYIVSSESFNLPFTLCFLQNTVAFGVVWLARAVGAIEADAIQLRLAKLWLPVTVIFTAMLITSFLRCAPPLCRVVVPGGWRGERGRALCGWGGRSAILTPRPAAASLARDAQPGPAVGADGHTV